MNEFEIRHPSLVPPAVEFAFAIVIGTGCASSGIPSRHVRGASAQQQQPSAPSSQNPSIWIEGSRSPSGSPETNDWEGSVIVPPGFGTALQQAEMSHGKGPPKSDPTRGMTSDQHQANHGDDVLVMPWQAVPPPDPAARFTELISPWQPPPVARPVTLPGMRSPLRQRDGFAARWRGGTIVPATAQGATQCALSAQSTAGKSIGYCVSVAHGPLVVTDLHVSGTCPADLFALGGSVANPTWIAFIPRSTVAHVTGASLGVVEGADLVIGTTAMSDTKIGRDLTCSLTWAGWSSQIPSLDSQLEDRF